MMTSINALSELIATVYESQMPFITKLLTTTFVPHSATNAILSAAADAGVELNKLNLTSGEMLKDSNSLISLLINNVSHSNQREKITDLDIPDEYICPITRNVMIDPVYSDHNPQRVERTAVLYWLQKRNIHPYTSCPLFEDDLKRDFKLKLKIDIFLEDKSQKNSTKGSNQTLIGLSIFKPQTQCFQEETMVDDITDQMMAESAFGKGSHTYKNRLANMVGENQSKLT
jgi:hypothetical protein